MPASATPVVFLAPRQVRIRNANVASDAALASCAFFLLGPCCELPRCPALVALLNFSSSSLPAARSLSRLGTFFFRLPRRVSDPRPRTRAGLQKSSEATVLSDSNLTCIVPSWENAQCVSTVTIFQAVPTETLVALNGTALNFQFTAAWVVVTPRTGPANGGGMTTRYQTFR